MFEMYVYLKEHWSSPDSSKPSTPQMQEVKVEDKRSACKSSPAATPKTKVEMRKTSTSQAVTNVSAPPKPTSIKKEAQRQVKEE